MIKTPFTKAENLKQGDDFEVTSEILILQVNEYHFDFVKFLRREI